VVYARSLGDTTLTLIVSGKLWRNSLIMMDEETKTLWSHVSGEALSGPLAGRQLEAIPSVQTTWQEWVAAHPETRVLKKPEEIRSSRYAGYMNDPQRVGIFRTFWLQDVMPAKTLVHGVATELYAVAIADSGLAAGATRDVAVGEDNVTFFRAADGGVHARTRHGGEIPVRTAYWFAWSAFYPHTKVAE
jgi:hypothetical protein